MDDPPLFVNADGVQCWGIRYGDGEPQTVNHLGTLCAVNFHFHRDNDLPAVVYPDGTCEWWFDGKRHRENDNPSTIYADGSQFWHQYGRLHRANKPAITRPDGYEKWALRGTLHRIGGPAITHEDGGREWWVNGERHREDGPAYICGMNEYQEWYIHDRLIKTSKS
jgi:hypothetical protein